MLKSYLAIIDQSGLREIHEELEATQAFLVCKLNLLSHPPSVLAWAVFESDNYPVIQWELRKGHKREALKLMQEVSKQLGTMNVPQAA